LKHDLVSYTLSLMEDKLKWGDLKITTSEKINGFLLIEVFRKLFNPQNNGHLKAGGLFLGA